MFFLANELKLDIDIVRGFKIVDYNLLKRHELVVGERFMSLTLYLQSLKPYMVLPSILVCNKTNVIIDGHHRFSALLELGIKKIPVTYIDYSNSNIIPHLDNSISKAEIIQAGESGILLQPKSSFHHVKNNDGVDYPIILLSSLFSINNIS